MSAPALTQSNATSSAPDLTPHAPDPVAAGVREGLTASPKTLPPWLFYDQAGSELFEQITALPEYYLTRTERALLATHARSLLETLGAPATIVELGAGTATKTGLVLAAAIRLQGEVLYQPIDVSESALAEAERQLESSLPGVQVQAQVANYITGSIQIARRPGHRVLAMYIGSSIGNFTPGEAHGILGKLRGQMQPGDALLLGTDLAPGGAKTVDALVSAYDDAAGVTARFNLNVLWRLNRELGADFDLDCFSHQALWNARESRIEMHLQSIRTQTVHVPANSAGAALRIALQAGETIHTENSYKFTPDSIRSLVGAAGFVPEQSFEDAEGLFAITFARAV